MKHYFGIVKDNKITIAMICAVLIAVNAFMLSGCGSTQSTESRSSAAGSNVAAVLEAGAAAADEENDNGVNSAYATDTGNNTVGASDTEKKAVLSKTEGIDIDLTILSSTVVYSEVYNMMYLPEDYIGKTIKMDGLFSSYHDEATGNDYYACIIQDATACCAQGIEFVATDDFSYPDDYPEDGDDITVIGVFDTYDEDGYTYCTLRDAKIL